MVTTEVLTTQLNDGRTVLAKLYKGKPSAVTYANLTQAMNKARQLGEEWGVTGRCPFYVMKIGPLKA